MSPVEKEALRKWRFKAPGIIAAFAVAPLVWKLGPTKLDWKATLALLDVGFGLAVSYIYHAFNVRKGLWIEEIENHVGAQIKSRILEMLPLHATATDAEMKILRDRKIIQRLDGIFWEAIRRDPQLSDFKEAFFNNGKNYTTAIDIFIIGAIAGYAYLIGLNFDNSIFYPIMSGGMLTASTIAWYVWIPNYRRTHLDLSIEQLDALQRNQEAFVSKSLQDAVMEIRSDAKTS